MKTKHGQTIPADIARAIRSQKTALAGFEKMPPSHQLEYLGYILGAKKPETRTKRIRKSITMMAKWYREWSKKRHW